MIDLSSVKSIIHGGKAVQSIADSKGTVWSAGRLPIGYQEVEYLEGTGSQYINTGIYDVDKIDCTWQLVTYSQWYGAYGNYIDEATNVTRLIGQHIDNDQMWFNHDSLAGQAIGVPVVARNKNRTIATNFGIDINGTFYPYDRPQGNKNTSNIVLFGQNSSQRSRIKIYRFAMYKDDILVRNYIPCIDPAGAVGMYDMVGKQFYGNAGAGTFVVGPAV